MRLALTRHRSRSNGLHRRVSKKPMPSLSPLQRSPYSDQFQAVLAETGYCNPPVLLAALINDRRECRGAAVRETGGGIKRCVQVLQTGSEKR